MVARRLAFRYALLIGTLGLAGPLCAQAPPRTVRVSTTGRVGTPHALTVTAGGAWRLIDLGDHHLVCEGTGRSRWQFECDREGRISVRGEPGSEPGQNGRLDASGFRLEGGPGDVSFTVGDGTRAPVYPGAVEVLPIRGRSGYCLRVVNEAPLEKYLTGVVTAEGSTSFQPEALKALAIAARSYTERNRLRHGPDAELCDTVHCQVYPGVGRVPEKVARAVADTAGVVALSSGEVIDAVYCTDCGGQTRNNEDAWPQRHAIPYLRSVEDRPPSGSVDYCAINRNHEFRLKLTPAQVARLLGSSAAATGPVRLRGVERDPSGRIVGVRVTMGTSEAMGGARKVERGTTVDTTDGGSRPDRGGVDADELLPCEIAERELPTTRTEPAAETSRRGLAGDTIAISTIRLSQLRQLLGDQLRGRLVDVRPAQDGGLELEGRGWGHGVGLCQWGAQGMALPPYNRNCEEILRHYFTGITLGAPPVRAARLSLQLAANDGQPLSGVSVQLLPGGPAGTTDGQGRWDAGSVPAGTYVVEARRGNETMTFYAVRVASGKSAETRLALVWRARDDRLARVRTGARGG